MFRFKFPSSIVSLLAVTFAYAGTALAAPPEHEAFFEAKIRPLFVEFCVECHGPQKQKSGLRLDSRDAMLKGGEGGKIVEPGNPDASLLMRLVKYEDEVRMPPKKKLSDEHIAALERWVKMGAPWPDAGTGAKTPTNPPNPNPVTNLFAKARAEYWSLQPIAKSAPPPVKHEAFVGNDLDRFVIARLEAMKLTPSPQADRRTLIRRATFDLIGLPPTFEEVEAFVNDKAANAWEKVIDRLLADKRYGERWGRHWLDVARYADTKGYTFTQDRRYPYSYTYRDYVIRAFNDDKLYDRFIIEQIAADKLNLGEQEQRSLAAMGFLTVGQRFNFKNEDIVDDRIDVVTRGLMGLTVTCARCHDHKYDPITQEDYYALYGIFNSSEEPEELPLISEPYPTPEFESYKAELAKREKAVEDYLQKTRRGIERELRERAGDYLSYLARKHPNHNEGPVLETSQRGELRRGGIGRWESYVQRTGNDAGSVFHLWHQLAKLNKDKFGASAAAEIAKIEKAVLDGKGVMTNQRVLDAIKGAQPQTFETVANVYGTLLEGVEREWREAVKNGAGQPPAALEDAASEQLRQVLYGEGNPASFEIEESRGLINRAERDEQTKLQKHTDELKATHAGAPPRAMVMVDRKQPVTQHVFLRGQPGRRGKQVERQFLELLTPIVQSKPFKDGSGRLDLALAIVNGRNPLTSRVLVNRVWQWHFGAGFVRDASDFGIRSEVPLNMPLLDHLATWFTEHGWSIKQLNKYIMMSRTYQQASDTRSEGVAIDPENRLFWKMNRLRLEFEPTRDSLLFVAGRLETKVGGRPVELTSQPFTTRRTVYGYIDRQDLPSVFRVFDLPGPDASAPGRPNTTTPQQALFMMNSPFVVEQANALMNRAEVVKHVGDLPRNITVLFQLAFSRSPSAQELAGAKAFVEQEINAGGDEKAWKKFAQALLLSNEFVFVD
ncbi:MAG: PSD1 and planctomycete cytochrome C domain-containing protein [Phycisphaeraceae bacterium]